VKASSWLQSAVTTTDVIESETGVPTSRLSHVSKFEHLVSAGEDNVWVSRFNVSWPSLLWWTVILLCHCFTHKYLIWLYCRN